MIKPRRPRQARRSLFYRREHSGAQGEKGSFREPITNGANGRAGTGQCDTAATPRRRTAHMPWHGARSRPIALHRHTDTKLDLQNMTPAWILRSTWPVPFSQSCVKGGDPCPSLQRCRYSLCKLYSQNCQIIVEIVQKACYHTCKTRCNDAFRDALREVLSTLYPSLKRGGHNRSV